MPRLAINYQNTIIYKIVCRDLAIKNCYVGHTTDFTNRKRGHKQGCNGIKQCYVHRFINENGSWNNWDMILVETYPCTNLYEASARERHWIETLNADLNQCLPPTGLAKSEYKKQYYAENRHKFIENHKQYVTENIDRIKEYQKQYSIEHSDNLKEYQRQRNSTKYCCIICRKEMRRDNFNSHYKRIHNIST